MELKNLAFIIFLLLLLVLAFLCIFATHKVQAFALSAVKMGATAKNIELASFIGSQRYILLVKSVGFLSLMVFVFLITAFFLK